MYLRNAWYVAATEDELTDGLLSRRILGENLVLFRTSDGSPAALEDACAHRKLPLSMGRKTDDGIECGSGCIVRGNSVRSNRGYGLNLGGDSAYSENVVTNNTTGTVTGVGSANSLGLNYCAGTGVTLPTCP